MTDTDALTAYDRALELYSVGEINLAIADLQANLQRDPDPGQLWELLGTLAFANRNFKLAQSSIEQASLLTPLSPRNQLVLAKCYGRDGYAETAATIYRHVAALDELPIDLLEPLISGLGSCKEYELALNVCRQAARRMPDNPAPFLGIVHYMRRLGRPLEIILLAMYRVHYLEPDNVEYRIALAWMLHEVGRSEDGAGLLESVAYGKFSCVRCLCRMRHILEVVGDTRNANICRARLRQLCGVTSSTSPSKG